MGIDSKIFERFVNKYNFTTIEYTQLTAATITRFSSVVESEMLTQFGLPHNDTTAGVDAPWFDCFEFECRALITAGDECSDWDVLLMVPDSHSRRDMYLAAVYTSWAILGVTALVVYFAFNAWPNYDSSESWERTARSLSRLMCCGNVLEGAETDTGQTASKGIGNLLHLLFGGIDLDPSDQIMGLVLVAERQKWRRRRHVIKALKRAGVSPTPPKPSWLARMFGWCRTNTRKTVHAASLNGRAVVLTGSLEGLGSITGPTGDAALGVRLASAASSLPKSPFETVDEQCASVVSAPATEPPPNTRTTRKLLSDSYTAPAIAHSFVRLVTFRPSEADVAAGLAVGPPPQGSAAFNSVSTGLTDSGGVSDTAAVEPSSLSTFERALVVEEASRPLITPVKMHVAKLEVGMPDYDAATLYGPRTSAVPRAELEDALELCAFAQAAYGLQTVRWKSASSGSVLTDSLDKFLACCGSPLRKPLGLDSRFRKRNYQAILSLTGAAPSDLLYVSYTSAAFGVLPYMLLLHRPSRSVVLSVRGTVGFENLITDLLSNPVDAAGAMPAWVLEQAAAEEAARGGKAGGTARLMAHAGILSSTNAVLSDLAENGLLEAMRNPGGAWTGTGAGADSIRSDSSVVREQRDARIMQRLDTLGVDAVVDLPLDHAQHVVAEAMAEEGWRLVVTGHSLGAAVACMVSFHLREHFPSLRCVAFNPPGGLLSAPLARISREFCTSVVVGTDAISRLGIPTMQRLIDDMVLALARCKRPKLAVLTDLMLGRRADPATAPPTFCAFEDIGPEAKAALQKYVATSKLHAAEVDMTELYPPGEVIFLRPFANADPKKRADDEAEVWDAVWMAPEGRCYGRLLYFMSFLLLLFFFLLSVVSVPVCQM